MRAFSVSFSIYNLDRIRSYILSKTLRYKIVKSIYLERKFRTILGFSFSLLLNLYLALSFPLHCLVYSAILLGVPHMVSSFRYSLYQLDKDFQKKKIFFSLVFAGIFIFLGGDVLGFLLQKTEFKEYTALLDLPLKIICAGSIASITGIFFKKSLNKVSFIAYGLFIFVLWLLWSQYYFTLGVFSIIHSVMAFLYWIKSAPQGEEKKIATFAFLVFLGINFLIAFGTFDPLLLATKPKTSVIGANGFEMEFLGFKILRWTINYHYLQRAVIILAFGQGLHYFLWLKIIPELHNKVKKPLSFLGSYRSLCKDLGPTPIVAFVVLFLLILSLSIFSLNAALSIFFSFGFLHIYVEMICFLYSFCQKTAK